MPSAEMLRFSQLIRARRQAQIPPVPEQRQQMEEMQSRLRVPEDVVATNFSIGACDARFVATPQSRAEYCLLYLHGGGYVQSSLNTHFELMGRIARSCRCRVLGLDYRLAPEHPFPAALEDALAAYRWLLAQGMAPARLMIGGDSAGGGLALATLLALREQNLPLPAGAVLLSPWTDLTGSGDSLQSRADADPMLSPEYVTAMAPLYYTTHDPRGPLISPCFADLAGLPPLLVQVGDAEILLDDSLRLAHAARAAGGLVELQEFEAAFHVFHTFPQVPESVAALTAIGAFFDRHTKPRGSN